jgi:hypothetical protein
MTKKPETHFALFLSHACGYLEQVNELTSAEGFPRKLWATRAVEMKDASIPG